MEPMAMALSNMGVTRTMVVHGQDGLDEISLCAPTTVIEMVDNKMSKYEIRPEQFGLSRCDKEDIVGGMPQENAQILKAILNGDKGPKRDIVLLNAGAALHIAKQISIEEGVYLAADIIDSGKAYAQMQAFIKATNE